MDNEKILLECSKSQARLIQTALDFYARALIGQFPDELDTLARHGMLAHADGKNAGLSLGGYLDQLAGAVAHLNLAKQKIMGLSPNSSWSILSEQVPDDARVAFDLTQVIRNTLARLRNPDGTSLDGVDFDTPYQTSQKEGFASVIVKAPIESQTEETSVTHDLR